MRYSRALAALVAALTLVLAGCSSSGSSETGKGFNNTDVDFASDMIQHHAQALEMVDLTMGRRLDPAVARLTEQIRNAQTPEIEKMAAWLQDWGKRVPPTSRDHAHAEEHGQKPAMGSDMPGMMSADQMAELQKASGKEFQEMWLEMMIDHHQGAAEMARTEVDNGLSAKAVGLARDIISAQEKEISAMQEVLHR